MPRKIKTIKLFCNDNAKSLAIKELISEKLIANNYSIVNENPDLCLAIGGDGSFLRMVKANNFKSEPLYVGINAGTLGFLQEIKIDDIDDFIYKINNNLFKIDEIGIQETKIVTTYNTSIFYSLNEIVLRDRDLNTTKLNINVNNAKLEKFVGDGILISTSTGSTAYNLSFGGAIVANNLHTLQVTPIAPLNSKSYRSLINSIIIPENTFITIIPEKENINLLVTIDGDNNVYNNVEKIETFVNKKRINCLRLENYNFFEKINEKFL